MTFRPLLFALGLIGMIAAAAAPAFAQDADALFAQGQRQLEEAHALFARSERSQGNWVRGEAQLALRAACELEHIEACKAYAETESTGRLFGSPTQTENQYWALGRACDLGDGEGCLKLGQAQAPIGVLGGRRTPENWAGGEAAFRRACEEHAIPDGCFGLAEVLIHISNPNRKGEASEASYRRACELGVQPACNTLAGGPLEASVLASQERAARARDQLISGTQSSGPLPADARQVSIEAELFSVLSEIMNSEEPSARWTGRKVAALREQVLADNRLDEEERRLITELSRDDPLPLVIFAELASDQTASSPIVVDAPQVTARVLEIRLKEILDHVDLTIDPADRPGSLKRLFDASLQSPSATPAIRNALAEEVRSLWAASTVEAGYQPFRGFISEAMGVVNEYSGEDNAALRGLLHASIEQGAEGAPVAMPRFLFNWIKPADTGSASP